MICITINREILRKHGVIHIIYVNRNMESKIAKKKYLFFYNYKCKIGNYDLYNWKKILLFFEHKMTKERKTFFGNASLVILIILWRLTTISCKKKHNLSLHKTLYGGHVYATPLIPRSAVLNNCSDYYYLLFINAPTCSIIINVWCWEVENVSMLIRCCIKTITKWRRGRFHLQEL